MRNRTPSGLFYNEDAHDVSPGRGKVVSLLNPQLTHAEPRDHLLQFYRADEPALTRNVVDYVLEGLRRGDGVLIIATLQHRRAFRQRLKTLVPAMGPDQPGTPILFLDAQATLDRFMLNGQPDGNRFETALSDAIRTMQSRARTNHVRAYGEMVGVLWQAGMKSGAIRLEEFWNRLIESTGCSLFCAYPIDIFDPECQSSEVRQVLCAHTHLLPVGSNGDLEAAVHRAVNEITAAESATAASAPTNGYHAPVNEHLSSALLPAAEASVLSLHSGDSIYAGQILSRARHHYQTERRFRALVENSSDIISLLNRQGKILYATPASQKVLGYEPSELLGRSLLDFIHPDDLPRAFTTLQETLATPRVPIHVELRLRRKNGESAGGEYAWIESITSNLLDDPDIGAIVSNARDITERKAAEEESQRQAGKLERFNAELEAFAYAVAHDLKEPLRSVSVFTELLTRKVRTDGDSQELASYIVDGVQRMSALLDDLLSFSALNVHGPLTAIELSCPAECAIKNLDTRIREASAEITLDPLPAVRGNPNHLMQLFQNLIGNAIKYRSEQPVRIHITASPAHPTPGSECVIKVKDNGIGIPPQYRDQIFGLFKRLHGREIPGTGIGLAICKKIVEAMGGKIWVESNPGAETGSVFCFTVTSI